jgi:hypothetical protein
MTETERVLRERIARAMDEWGLAVDPEARSDGEPSLMDGVWRVVAPIVAERDEARQQAQRYLEGAKYERERAASEARAVDTLRGDFRRIREDRDMERGKRVQAEHERDQAVALVHGMSATLSTAAVRLGLHSPTASGDEMIDAIDGLLVELAETQRERDAHVHTLDHVLGELHAAVGGDADAATLATFPDALEAIRELRWLHAEAVWLWKRAEADEAAEHARVASLESELDEARAVAGAEHGTALALIEYTRELQARVAARDRRIRDLEQRAVILPDDRSQAWMDLWNAMNRHPKVCGAVSEERLNDCAWAALALIESWRGVAAQPAEPTRPLRRDQEVLARWMGAEIEPARPSSRPTPPECAWCGHEFSRGAGFTRVEDNPNCPTHHPAELADFDAALRAAGHVPDAERCTVTDDTGRRCVKGRAMPHHHEFDLSYRQAAARPVPQGETTAHSDD